MYRTTQFLYENVSIRENMEYNIKNKIQSRSIQKCLDGLFLKLKTKRIQIRQMNSKIKKFENMKV